VIYYDDLQQAAKHAETAIKHMKAGNIPCTAHNFMVWYEYFTGRNPALKKSINVVMSNKQRFTADRNQQIYDKFFSDQGAIAVDDLTARMDAAASQIAAALKNSGQSTQKYDQALKNFSGGLKEETGSVHLESMIADMLLATESMESEIHALQSQVDESAHEISGLRVNLQSARKEAMTDGLTGLANRKCFDDKLRTAVADAMETGEPLSLIMADLDHFKRLNDTFGHQMGDRVLQFVAQVLLKGIKGQDLAARYGGEEFTIILPDTPLIGAQMLADKLRKTVGAQRIVKKGAENKTEQGVITLSMGVTDLSPGEPIEQFLGRADQLLYNAKKFGRNRVVAETAPKASQGEVA